MQIKILVGVMLLVLIGAGCKNQIKVENGARDTSELIRFMMVTGTDGQPMEVSYYEQDPDLQKPLFFNSKKGGFLGTIEAKGYLKVVDMDCAGLGLKKCDNNKYAYFVETNTDNLEVLNFIATNKNKFYFDPPYAIGLGCWEEWTIYAKNFADDRNSNNIIKGDQLLSLQSSSKEKPVSIKMVVPVYTSKTQPQDLCYSRVREVEIK